MAKHVEKSGGLAKALKLFLLILVVLLVPMAMDQLEVEREQVQLVGRVAAVTALLMLAYGVFKKVLKLLGFVVLALITLEFLVAEGELKAPRIQQWFADRAPGGR